MNSRPNRIDLLSLCMAVLLTCLPAVAQSTSLLRGAITDPSGAAIADAKITLTNAETGLKRNAISGTNG